jgi:predicted Zn finger-like uncharacterized protein
MHVVCPNCRARYAVDPRAIGPIGRTVQCVCCNHRWFEKAQTPPMQPDDSGLRPASSSPTVPTFIIRPSTPGAGLPAIAHPQANSSRVIRLAAAIGLGVLLAVAAFAYRQEIRDRLPAEWRPLLDLGKADHYGGQPARARLAVDVPASKVELVDGRFVVQGKLVNNGGAAGSTSVLKVVFRSDERVLAEHTYSLVEGSIAPGTRVNFRQTLDDPPAGATNIVPTVQ